MSLFPISTSFESMHYCPTVLYRIMLIGTVLDFIPCCRQAKKKNTEYTQEPGIAIFKDWISMSRVLCQHICIIIIIILFVTSVFAVFPSWTCFGIGSNVFYVCSYHGKCIGNNLCSCDAGYSGAECNIWSCSGTLRSDPGVCSGHGICTSSNHCSCISPYIGDMCETSGCSPVSMYLPLRKQCDSYCDASTCTRMLQTGLSGPSLSNAISFTGQGVCQSDGFFVGAGKSATILVPANAQGYKWGQIKFEVKGGPCFDIRLEDSATGQFRVLQTFNYWPTPYTDPPMKMSFLRSEDREIWSGKTAPDSVVFGPDAPFPSYVEVRISGDLTQRGPINHPTGLDSSIQILSTVTPVVTPVLRSKVKVDDSSDGSPFMQGPYPGFPFDRIVLTSYAGLSLPLPLVYQGYTISGTDGTAGPSLATCGVGSDSGFWIRHLRVTASPELFPRPTTFVQRGASLDPPVHDPEWPLGGTCSIYRCGEEWNENFGTNRGHCANTDQPYCREVQSLYESDMYVEGFPIITGWGMYYCDTYKCESVTEPGRLIPAFDIGACGSYTIPVAGRCVAQEVCECLEPVYEQPLCARRTCYELAYDDPGVCGGHGTCVAPDTCICDPVTVPDYYYPSIQVPRYTLPYCAYTKCFGIFSTAPEACNGNYGYCNGTDQCVCMQPGAFPPDCHPLRCGGLYYNDPLVCNGHGECTDVGTDVGLCVCTPRYTGTLCQNAERCFGIDYTDPLVCSGRGECTAPDVCVCNVTLGYTGTVCTTTGCYGISSTNVGVCSGHGRCIAPNECICAAGYTGDDCDEYECAGVPASNEEEVCSGHGVCAEWNLCHCISPWTGKDCNTSIVCNATCGANGECLFDDHYDSYCACLSGHSGVHCELTTVKNMKMNFIYVAASCVFALIVMPILILGVFASVVAYQRCVRNVYII